jgi:hypothetical protein
MRLRTIKKFVSSYFTEPSGQKYLFYLACLFYVIITSIIVIVEPYLDIPCEDDTTQSSELEFGNSLYIYSKCNSVKHAKLLYFSRVDCLRGRHLLMAVFLGALIGYERRSSDRPAGIRTMSCKYIFIMMRWCSPNTCNRVHFVLMKRRTVIPV